MNPSAQPANQPAKPSQVLPRPALIAAGLVVASSIGLAALGPGAVGGRTPPPQAPVLAERSLVFTDLPDRGVGVFERGTEVTEFTGEQGFLRGVLRGLNRTRKVNGLPADAPFHLAAYADGRLVLDDPSTGVLLDLAAYGASNEEVFAHLLPVHEYPVQDRFK